MVVEAEAVAAVAAAEEAVVAPTVVDGDVDAEEVVILR